MKQPQEISSTAMAGLTRGMPAGFSVLLCVAAAILLLAVLHALGMTLNGDLDDQLKLLEIRHLLETGDIFDRAIPGILQPEPYVTHWPWIVDLPYAAVASLLRPFVGLETALSVAVLCVPPLLLAAALPAYHRLLVLAGFDRPSAVLPLVTVLALPAFFEFAPGRVDYHNLQILLLLVALALLCASGRRAAFVNGLLAALALAISLEFAAFYGLILAVHAIDFIAGRDKDGTLIAAFGGALAAGAVALFVLIVPPASYAAPRCDSYSAPHLLALAAAGLSFAGASVLGRRRGAAVRIALLGVPAVAAILLLMHAFPQCLAGPYGAISDYVRVNQLGRIAQEKTLVSRPDVMLSPGILMVAALVVGALALPMAALSERIRSRPRLILALAALVAVVQAIAYFRYLRYVPLFSGIGLAFILSALPGSPALSRLLRSDFKRLSSAELAAPGVVLVAILFGWTLFAPAKDGPPPPGELADGCTIDSAGNALAWPVGARLLAPPATGLQMLSLSPALRVVAIPNHPASPGIERAYRFLDPATPDPRAILRESEANFVAVCAWRGAASPDIEVAYPLATALMQGRPPDWLTECPTGERSPIRIYSYREADGTQPACPTPSGSAQGTTISIR